MKTIKIINTSKDYILGDKITEAKSVVSRIKGLIGRKEIVAETGLLIPKCGSIHTFFMSMAIDVIFLDIELRIIKLVKRLETNKLCSCWNAAYVLELPVGTVDKSGSEIGDRVEISK